MLGRIVQRFRFCKRSRPVSEGLRPSFKLLLRLDGTDLLSQASVSPMYRHLVREGDGIGRDISCSCSVFVASFSLSVRLSTFMADLYGYF